jgi:thioredoxin reductase (NADPH)
VLIDALCETTLSDVDEELAHEEAFPRLSHDLLAVLEAAGERRRLTQGEVLSRAGEVTREFCVVARGSLAGHEDHGSTTERPIRVIGEGRFWGGTNLLTGQPAYITTVAAEDSEVIVLSIDQLRGVIAANQQLGDLILGAFVARRALLIGLAAGLRLVGSRLSPDTRRLREFLACRSRPTAAPARDQPPGRVRRRRRAVRLDQARGLRGGRGCDGRAHDPPIPAVALTAGWCRPVPADTSSSSALVEALPGRVSSG